MKKFFKLVLTIMLIITLTGCGNNTLTKKSGSLTCVKNEVDEDGFNVEDTMVVTYKNDIVTNVTNTNIQETDSSIIEMTVSFGTMLAEALNQLDGFNVSYSQEGDTKVKQVMSVDFEQIDIEQLKEYFKDDFDENSYYAEKDQTIDEFKENSLKDYNCK